MSREKLNGLVILSIEQDLLENIEYKSLISNFVTEIVCKVIFHFFFKDRRSYFFASLRPHNSQDMIGVPHNSEDLIGVQALPIFSTNITLTVTTLYL